MDKKSTNRKVSKRQVPVSVPLDGRTLTQVIGFLPDPTFAIDMSRRVIIWNRAMEELTGVPSGKVIGRGDYEYALPFYGIRRPILIDLTLEENREVEGKYTFVERKGDSLTAETVAVICGRRTHLWGKASPIYDADGEVVGAIESIRDITDRKAIEEELLRKDAKIRDIFENVNDFLYVHDLDGRIIESNLTYKDYYGFSGVDLTNRYLQDILSEKDRLAYQDYLSGILARGTAEGTIRVRTSSGGYRILEYSDSLIYGEDGRPSLIRGSARDVTERVLAEQGLRESEQRYRLLAQNVKDVIWVLDLNLRYTYVSPSVERLRGYTPEETTHQTLKDFLLPKSYELAARVFAHEMSLEKQGQRHDPFWSTTLELQMRHRDGHPIWTEVTASFLRDMDGNPTNILGVTRDITTRKEAQDRLRLSEERFKQVAENAGEWIWEVDTKGVYQYASPVVERILGYSPGELIGRKRFHELFVPEEREILKSQALRMMRDKMPFQNFQNANLHKNGRVVLLETSATPVLDAKGKLVGYRGVDRDITELKKAEEEGRIYEARLMRSQRLEAIGTLAGGIAHDFNNILSAIIGYAELALDDIEKGGPAEQCVNEVLRGGDRAKDLVSQILTFSRQIQAEKQVVNMAVILKEAMKLLRSTIPSTIRIVLDIAPDAPPVFADPTQVHQVIMNLCTNAYQAMLERGGLMSVSLAPALVDEGFARKHPLLTPGPFAVLTVKDTGYGMGPETMNRIFEPFFTTREKSRGTGLGLSTVHGIVTELSGTVLVTSRIGHGSTFSVYLPAHAGGYQEQAMSQEAIPRGNGEKILMVDDETAILEFAKNLLVPLGYSVTSTSSSTEALAVYSSDPQAFDLVITDQTMPLLTGMELASRMLGLRGDLPIILVTGFSETVTPEEALQSGIRVYLEKPFTKKAIASAIKDALAAVNP